MNKRLGFVLLAVLAVVALASTGCLKAKLGTDDNPIVMSFVPSGDTQDIIASGDLLAEMISEKTGLVVKVVCAGDMFFRPAFNLTSCHLVVSPLGTGAASASPTNLVSKLSHSRLTIMIMLYSLR